MELVIKRSQWLHGEGSMCSFLLREDDKKMCCLGFFSLACGATPEKIEGLMCPREVVSRSEGTPLTNFDWLFERGNFGYSEDSFDAKTLMVTNDYKLGGSSGFLTVCDGRQNIQLEDLNSEQEREQRITEIFAKHGVTVRFED